MTDAHVVMLSRIPVPGKVKTRLERVLRPRQCALLQEALALDALERLSHAGFPLELCYSDEARKVHGGASIEDAFIGKAIGACAPQCDLRVSRQRGCGLGERMRNAMADCFGSGAGPCVVVGSDLPFIMASDVRSAVLELAENDVVLGPCIDGGYWLVGCRAPFPELFAGKRYGDGRVLADALETCRFHGRTVALLREMPDVDLPADLAMLVDSAEPRTAPVGARTAQVIRELLDSRPAGVESALLRSRLFDDVADDNV